MDTSRIDKLLLFLKDNPSDCFLNHALALEYIKSGDEQKARAFFEVNLTNDPAYVATYYHLGKLMERAGEIQQAIDTFAKGMVVAKAAKDNHSYNELQGAHDELAY